MQLPNAQEPNTPNPNKAMKNWVHCVFYKPLPLCGTVTLHAVTVNHITLYRELQEYTLWLYCFKVASFNCESDV